MDNKLASESWVVVVSPKTGNRLAIPCKDSLTVVLKARTVIESFGDAFVDLTAEDLKEFHSAWIDYQNRDLDMSGFYDFPSDSG